MPRRRKTPAERARARSKSPSKRARAIYKRNPGLTHTEIAAQAGLTRQGVATALSAVHERRGRPGTESRTQRLSVELLDRAAAAAKFVGMSTRQWIELAITKRLR